MKKILTIIFVSACLLKASKSNATFHLQAIESDGRDLNLYHWQLPNTFSSNGFWIEGYCAHRVTGIEIEYPEGGEEDERGKVYDISILSGDQRWRNSNVTFESETVICFENQVLHSRLSFECDGADTHGLSTKEWIEQTFQKIFQPNTENPAYLKGPSSSLSQFPGGITLTNDAKLGKYGIWQYPHSPHLAFTDGEDFWEEDVQSGAQSLIFEGIRITLKGDFSIHDGIPLIRFRVIE